MNMSKKRKIVIIILSILLILAVLVILICISPTQNDKKNNYYHDPNEKVITNRDFKKEKCVNQICVKDITVAVNGNLSSIVYKITNKGDKDASGYLKIVFNGTEKKYLVYNLKAGETKPGTIGVNGKDLSNVETYELQELTDAEYAVFAN